MTELTDRIERFEKRLRWMEEELYELRRIARTEAQTKEPLWAVIAPEPEVVSDTP
jgi:hypothetical protein